MAELRELAREVVQQGVGRLRRRARSLAALVGIDVDAVRSVARKALDTAQSLRAHALPGRDAQPLPTGALQREAADPSPVSVQAPEVVAAPSVEAVEAVPSPVASAPVRAAPQTPQRVRTGVQGGFFHGPGRTRVGLRGGGQLRVFARDAWTLFALWEVGPWLRPAGAPEAGLELRLRPLGGAVTERLEVPLSGRRYFEGLVPGRTYLVELWWRSEGRDAEPVAVVPRSATLPVGPSRDGDPEGTASQEVSFVRVEWAPPRGLTRRGSHGPAALTASDHGAESLARIIPAAVPAELASLTPSGLRAAARVGWAGSPDEAQHALSTATSSSPQGPRSSSPTQPWSGSPSRRETVRPAAWAGSADHVGRPPASGQASPTSPGGARPQDSLQRLLELHRLHAAPPGPRVQARKPSTQTHAIQPPREAPSAGAHGQRPLVPPPSREHAGLPTVAAAPAGRQRRRPPPPKSHAAALAAAGSPAMAPVHGAFFLPSEPAGASVSGGFFVRRVTAPVRKRRPLAPAREGAPLASAETPRRRG